MTYPVVPIELRHIESFGECVGEVARERRFLAIVDGFGPEQNAQWVAVNRALGNPLYVALDAERVIGWCEIRRESLPGREHSAALGIGVRAAYRRMGVGRRLIDAAIAEAWRRGLARIELWVRAPNTGAIHLYEKVGFVREGCRHDAVRLDAGSEDELLMALMAPSRQRSSGKPAVSSGR